MNEFLPRERALAKIGVGDLFCVDGTHGILFICLATSITELTIYSRSITHQLEIDFDRRSGIGRDRQYGLGGTINSIARLPPDIYETLIDLDRRYQRPDPGPLSKAEFRALAFIDDFYEAHPIEEER